ncbi:MAG: hypothetical protein K2K45_10930 [Muribaculaceae bacterium]|nr:hypothetical protein [Muribaculaceae bacterium]
MNITEISNGDRVLIQRTPKEKEVATFKAIISNGNILVRDTSGEIIEVLPDQIIKKF